MKDVHICVVAGTHGNEYGLGKLVQDYIAVEAPGKVYALVGNPRAVEADTRFIDSDLNRSFAGNAKGYEKERVQEIEELFRTEGFTHVIDIHTSPTTDGLIGIVPYTCLGNETNTIINAIPEMINLVDLPYEDSTSSMVGSFGLGGIGVECPRFDYNFSARTIGDGILRMLGGIVLPGVSRMAYYVDGTVPIDLQIPAGSLRDFDEIPVLGGYAFVVDPLYIAAGLGHQGMRASQRHERVV